jgi:hypothetical protein
MAAQATHRAAVRRVITSQRPDATNIAASATSALTLPMRGSNRKPAAREPAIAPATLSEYITPTRRATSCSRSTSERLPAMPSASGNPMPMKSDGGRIAITTACQRPMVFQPCSTVHKRKAMLPTAATPVSACTMPSAATWSRGVLRIHAAINPPIAIPPRTTASMAVNACVVAMTNCSINRNHTISRPSEAKPETMTTIHNGHWSIRLKPDTTGI